jgi:dolichyl-phosphate-mannose-protein mannosyltransferase
VKSKRYRYEASLRLTAWIGLAAIVTAVLWARIRLAGLPLERDEGEYAYSGRLILQAISPYKLAYTMKFPGTSAVYAAVMSIFGESTVAVHMGLAVANLATIVLMFLLGRKILGELGGVVTAASYSVLSLMPHVLGTAAHATHFVVLFAVAGTLVLLRSSDRRRVLLIFTSGCLFGLALLMKQPGLLFVVFGSCYLLAQDWRAQLDPKKIVSRNLLFISGASVPCLFAGLLLVLSGSFGKFWLWTIDYAAKYGSQVRLADAAHLFAGRVIGVLGTAWPIWAVAAVGLLACVISPAVRSRAGFIITFSFFSALAICPGFYFRPHYFVLFLPALSLLSGAALAGVFKSRRTDSPAFRFAVLAVFAACLMWPLWRERDFFFEVPLAEANRMINGTNPCAESIKIAEYIRAHSDATDTIAVLGSEPQIYFYSQRRSATGYIYTYPLMEPQPYAHQMQEEMIHEIEAARPRFLVLVVMDRSWAAGPESDKAIYRWADAFCDANYEEVGLVNISDEGTHYYWGGRPPDVTPTLDHILVYRRKT